MRAKAVRRRAEERGAGRGSAGAWRELRRRRREPEPVRRRGALSHASKRRDAVVAAVALLVVVAVVAVANGAPLLRLLAWFAGGL